MGLSKDYTDVPAWSSTNTGYAAGSKVKYNKSVYVATWWSTKAPGVDLNEGWRLYDELYDLTSPTPATTSRVVAYLPTWTSSFQYSNSLFYRSLTHVIISFLMFDPAKIDRLSVATISQVNAILPAVIIGAGAKKVSIMVAVGGASDSTFNNLCRQIGLGGTTSTTYLNNAANSIATFVKSNVNIKGVDLDLEGWTSGGRLKSAGPDPAGKGLALLAKKLRTLLPSPYIISAAVFASPYYGNNYDATMQASLNWIGIMTYDLTGSWSRSPVGPHSALNIIRDQNVYSSEQHGAWPDGIANNPILSAEEALWYWTNPIYINWQGLGQKVPRNKVMLGIPCYGYDFSYAASSGSSYLTVQYSSIVASYSSVSNFANGNVKVAGTTAHPAFTGASGTYPYSHNIYFDSPQNAAAKQTFCKTVGCFGTIIWEMTQDTTGTASILDAVFNASGNVRV